MKVLCTVKRVVDPESKVKFAGDGLLDLSAVEYKLNPFDEYGIEEAVRLKDKGVATEIVLVSVGVSDAQQQLRTGLAMGADRAILVQVDDENDYDTLDIAKILAAVIEKEEPDLTLLGKLSVDAEGNQVGQMLAELTGMGQATFAFELAVDGDDFIVGREVDGGTASVRVTRPALVTADLRLNEPRYPSLPNIMKAKKKPLDVIEVDSLGIDVGNRVETFGYELPPKREAGEVVDSVATLVDRLKNKSKVI